jgi:peptidoglycan/xylan/chitin deacetylase (PgdA/CDA1 family)
MTHLERLSIKVAALPWGLGSRYSRPGVCFLIYHRIGGQLPLDIDLPLALFRRQLDYLSQTGRVMRYDDALDLLKNDSPAGDDLFVLTFDDGYEDFYIQVFPLLRELGLPATLFVTTGFVEGEVSPLTDSGLDVRPVTWEMLAEMQTSGLVTLGAHTHSHPSLTGQSPDRITEELAYPIELFRQRLDCVPGHFAYPRAIWDEQVEEQVKRLYRTAVIADGQKAMATEFDPYRIPRIPIRASDGWLFFRAKIRGWLAAEEQLYAALRRIS